ncbi:MAG: PAS domain S-box protein [Ignavibacteriales bacterium]|nr:PAS domain S-box protein [Ignavibacteriales bacterium]
MSENLKTYNDLLLELQVLKQENESLTIRFDRDIFRHYIEEESLMISESRYRRLFESAKDGILILNAETGKIVDVNQFLIDLLGYSKEKFVEKEIWEIGFFKDVVANIDKFQELQEKEYVRYENLPLETFAGRKINVEFVSNVYLENNKKVIQCNIRDITVRKHHEEELHKLSMAVQQSPASVLITDINGNVEFANAKVTAITGYELAEVMGKNSRIFSSGEMQHEEYKKLWDNISSGKEWRGEFRNKKKNGELFWERAAISPIVNEKGVITNYMAIKEDITENKKMLDELIMAKEKAEEMNRVKSSFFSNMSHELRTPLIGVLGFSEILEELLEGKPDLCKMAKTIRVSGQRLMRTLNFILDIAKLESSKTQICLQDTNIVPLLREIADLFEAVAAQKKLAYSFIPQ